ncbi:hypothetical protein ACTD5D_22255 [Nocardia takedensis]|uniref:hypothetical protein n=1 Tax=Nocardia takedensis TaxID=259390 RepID=UPI000310DA7D|nr:hypothetical protein [Nocardia takedensis]
MPEPSVVVERGAVHIPPAAVEALLGRLAEVHPLADSDFTHPKWVAEPDRGGGTCHLLAVRGGVLVGFLAGRPRTGHIALLGALAPGNRAGRALLETFASQAVAAGATRLSVVLDTEIEHRWQRRRFFETNSFRPERGSALHFLRDL